MGGDERGRGLVEGGGEMDLKRAAAGGFGQKGEGRLLRLNSLMLRLRAEFAWNCRGICVELLLYRA